MTQAPPDDSTRVWSRSAPRHRKPAPITDGPFWLVPAPEPRSGLQARYVLIVFQPAAGREELGSGTFHRLQALLRDGVTTEPDVTELDVWLESRGGDPHAVYKIGLLLRAHCALLRAVVPDTVQGAATLLTLCADEIYMAPAAGLGPLAASVDPNHGLSVIGRYAEELVSRRNTGLVPADRTPDAARLLSGYPDRDFVIDPVEAQDDVGLPVRPLAQYPAGADVVRLHRAFLERPVPLIELRAQPWRPLDDPATQPLVDVRGSRRAFRPGLIRVGHPAGTGRPQEDPDDVAAGRGITRLPGPRLPQPRKDR